eukprot:CAMPEP_0202398076 /NCGR_PEP_ID=MMETSP1128-20130828/1033_1 /ASSEMBLY_ACC=CAM_ASM_000463 /TAXON_ID=3047 /ORGANISM="Dunaliella tertiolecta, Strain CCMP1320" /LENGTH=824 /DNA_ID=CAMNT_0049001133 /DNA_START=49 /DNA_END=2524 /DNA_ORIENTATION=-
MPIVNAAAQPNPPFLSRAGRNPLVQRRVGSRWGCHPSPLSCPLLGAPRTTSLRAFEHIQQSSTHTPPLRVPSWWSAGLAAAVLRSSGKNTATVGSDVSDQGSEGRKGREHGKARRPMGEEEEHGSSAVSTMNSNELDAAEEEDLEESSMHRHHHAHSTNTAFQYSFKPDSTFSSSSNSSLDTVDDSQLFPWSNGEENGAHAAGHGPMSTNSLAKSNYAVLRLEPNGNTRRFFVRRRDLLREHKLQPRDLRRIDPAIDFTKTSPSITVKENALLLCLGGVRAIVTAEKALLFEPNSPATRRFIETMVPHLQSKVAQREFGKGDNIVPASDLAKESALVQASHSEYMARFQLKNKPGSVRMPPFELEMLEGALIVATGFLDAELSRLRKRVQALLTKLPHDINPKGLEELRKVKTALVEAEDRTDTLRNMLEELMDDEDELREMNLLSRPRREERRRQRERERLERELERAREIKEELEDRLEEDEHSGAQATQNPNQLNGTIQIAPTYYVDPDGKGYASWTGGVSPQWDKPLPSVNGNGSPTHTGSSKSPTHISSSKEERQERLHALRSKFDKERAALLKSRSTLGSNDPRDLSGMSRAARKAALEAGLGQDHPLRRHHHHHHHHHTGHRSSSHAMSARDKSLARERDKLERELERAERLERLRLARSIGGEGDGDWINRLEAQLEGSEEDIMEAQEALEEMMEQEEEEYEVEEVEDLMEYYLQRASAAQSEAERLLAGARDLEESIGVSLSARRFEVNRLELTLSIASFAAAIGAVVAGIFGMNMRSMLENSILGFWGVACFILLGCTFLFFTILRYTRRKRIL